MAKQMTALRDAVFTRTHGEADVVGAATSGWQPARGVLECVADDLTVLLNLNTSEYHTLDAIGGGVWSRLRDGGASVTTLARVVAAEWDGADEQITHDVEALVRDLFRRGLVTPAQHPGESHVINGRPQRAPSAPRKPAPRGPGTLACIAGLCALRVSLKVFGLRRVWRWVHVRAAALCTVPPSERFLQQAALAVASAATLSPLRAQCLEQSLYLLWWLGRCGVVAELRFGVLPYPFKAHAWVEYQGEPLNDTRERLALYRTFLPVSFDQL